MITHTREFITPEIAKSYLNTSRGNRPLSKATVNMYVREILSGHFLETHQGIAFDENGHLCDGHHRLKAIVLANKGISIDVARGLPREAIVYLDNGLTRSTANAMHFAGIYSDNPILHNNETLATVRQFAYLGTGSTSLYKLGNDEIFALLETFEDELRTIYYATTTRPGVVTTGAMRAAALAALVNGESEKDIFNFFDVYGNSVPTDNPNKNSIVVLNWRQQMLMARAKHSAFSRTTVYLGTQNAIWNYCNGTNSRVLRMTEEPRYPAKNIIIDALQNAKEEDK